MSVSPYCSWLVPFSMGVEDPVAFAASRADEFQDLSVADGGTRVVDVVGRVANLGRALDGVLDFGDVRFRTAHQAVELLVTLTGQGGGPFVEPVVLAGLPSPQRVRRSDWDTNPYYRHMAMAQRKDQVRVLLTRAGWRLLRANPERLIQFAGRSSPEMVGTVVIEPEDRPKLEAGARKLRASCTLGPRNSPLDTISLLEPPDWALGEPSFAWR